MKKILLSGSLIILFILYGLHQQQENNNLGFVKPPKSISLPSTDNPVKTIAAPTPSAPYTSPSPNLTSPPSSIPSTPSPTAPPSPQGQYKDGTYTGSIADASYGNVQVSATINNGKLVKINFLQYPNTHSASVYINTQAIPYLQQEAIQAQSSQVDGVTGASYTSQAFIQSLSSALNQAQ